MGQGERRGTGLRHYPRLHDGRHAEGLRPRRETSTSAAASRSAAPRRSRTARATSTAARPRATTASCARSSTPPTARGRRRRRSQSQTRSRSPRARPPPGGRSASTASRCLPVATGSATGSAAGRVARTATTTTTPSASRTRSTGTTGTRYSPTGNPSASSWAHIVDERLSAYLDVSTGAHRRHRLRRHHPLRLRHRPLPATATSATSGHPRLHTVGTSRDYAPSGYLDVTRRLPARQPRRRSRTARATSTAARPRATTGSCARSSTPQTARSRRRRRSRSQTRSRSRRARPPPGGRSASTASRCLPVATGSATGSAAGEQRHRRPLLLQHGRKLDLGATTSPGTPTARREARARPAGRATSTSV